MTFFFTFAIYTKPGELGTYTCKNIFDTMDNILNMKIFALETTTLKMRICKFFSYNEFKNDDIIGANVTYEVIVHNTIANVKQFTLDKIGDYGIISYSMWKLSASYEGNILRARRSSDDEELDIGISGNYIDQAALEAFTIGTNAFCPKLYAQNGGKDAYQTDSTKQPQIVSNGSFLGGLVFDGTDDWLLIDDDSEHELTDDPISIYANANITFPNSGGKYIFCRNDTTFGDIQYSLLLNSNAATIVLGGVETANFTMTQSENKTLAVWEDETADGVTIKNEGLSGTGQKTGSLTNYTNNSIGARNVSGAGVRSFFFDGTLRTLIVFNSDRINDFNILKEV
jgi:hypothetical protein